MTDPTKLTFDSAVEIEGREDTPQLTVQGHTTQDQPLQTWEDHSGAEVAQLNGDGSLDLAEQSSVPGTPPSGMVRLFVDQVSGHLKQKNDQGVVVDLTGGGGAGYPQAYISGFEVTCAGGTGDVIDIAPGICRDADNSCDIISTSALSLDTDATGAGGLDTGSLTADTWYFVWVIAKSSDGTVSALLSTSSTSPTMPAGYDKKRRVGSLCTDSDGDLISMFVVKGSGGSRRLVLYDDFNEDTKTSIYFSNITDSWTDVDCSKIVPPTSCLFRAVMFSWPSTNDFVQVRWREKDKSSQSMMVIVQTVAGVVGSFMNDLPLDSNQHGEVKNIATYAMDEQLSIEVMGYWDDLAPAITGTTGVNTTVTNPMPNHLINGNFDIWQRGTEFTSTDSANSDNRYTADRWVLLSDGDDVVDVTRESTNVPDSSAYSLQAEVETANKKFGFLQVLEMQDALALKGKTLSLSFKARTETGKAIENVRAAILAWTGTADTVTSDAVSAWGTEGSDPTLAENWTYENTPTNIPLTADQWTTCSIANIDFDTNGAKNLAVFIWVDDTDAAVDDILQITQVKLEIGSSATEFLPKKMSEEFDDCLRYFYCMDSSDAAYARFGSAHVVNSTQAQVLIAFPTQMRVVPSFTYSANADFSCGGTTSGITSVQTTVFTAGLNVSGADIDTSQLQANNTSDAWLHFDAEL
jgi:hypothetical protein